MNHAYVRTIAAELSIQPTQVAATATLLSEGGTVPFIARYRKERTGELDEVAIAAIRDRLQALGDLDHRRDSMLKSLTERELLSDDLKTAILSAETLTALEDIYLPYRPKRRTRATIAREKGLEPLAHTLFEQAADDTPESLAAAFVNQEKDVTDADAALAGARDIIAEWVNEDADARQNVRELFETRAAFESHVVPGKEEEGAKFRDYFESSEPITKVAGHRALAMFRGEKEGILSLFLRPEKEEAIARLKRRFVNGSGPVAEQVGRAVEDAYGRLMGVSLEVEARMKARNAAGEEAIKVFAQNLRELLMGSPLGRKAVLAMDPAYRTGAKVVCLDPQGKLLFHTTVFITHSDRQKKEAAGIIVALCRKFEIEAIAVGNGTASRETLAFARELQLPRTTAIVQVNESGASIYSASEVARNEFPDLDLTVRGAVSIGRRLMDPLAELVKLDPKAIGVGQYQHDVDQTQLKRSLDDVVGSCVNSVGVEVNSASKELLSYVAGLGPTLAGNIVAQRDTGGPFTSRKALLKVPRLGPKAFEQAAGFLRIGDAVNPLDASAVHPERYPLVERMAKDAECNVKELIGSDALRKSIPLEKYVDDSVGLPTLRDILTELAKPGRDPRQGFEAFQFAEGVETLEDLRPGMKLPGIVTNVTNFGAFVDIGVHQDGLVHISELSDTFVSSPADVIKVNQKVTVQVLEVDLDRKRASLSMRSAPREQPHDRAPRRDGEGAGRQDRPRHTRPAARAPKRNAPPARKKIENSAMTDAFSSLDGLFGK